MRSPTIYIENAYLEYAGEILFDRLNLTLPAGKIAALLGPSGVGKTSLLNLIAGLAVGKNTLQTGTVRSNQDKPLAQQISYMAQNDLLFPWLTVLENTLVGNKLRGNKNSPTDRELAKEILTKVGLDNVFEKYPEELSGGMRQRTALARTLMENRPIVLLDEPFSSLDMITRLKLQDLAMTVLSEKTVLLVTHDPLEALHISDQIILMTGKPVQFEILTLNTPPPRDISSKEVLMQQQLILQKMLANS